MSLIPNLGENGALSLAGRALWRILAPGQHGRQHGALLQRGPPAPKAARQARAGAWWGAEPRWFPAGTPPRLHNRVTPLIDGASYFAALHRALAEAQHYAYIIGWCLTPYIPIARADGAALRETRLLPLLAQVAQHVPVRILLWAGAPVLFQPSTRYAEEVQATIERAGGLLQCRLDRSAHFTHCHHQKAIVVDGRVAFLGGMDLTSYTADRWDTPAHPLRAGQNWHDAQLQIEGEAVADVEQNFRQRWEATTGDAGLPHQAPPCDPAWRQPVQVLRTIPARTYAFAPDGEFGILHWYGQALRRAQRLIYLENQYLWSPHIMRALLAALEAPRPAPFRIVLVLPAFAGDGRWDNDKHVDQLRKADRGRGIVSIYALFASGPNAGARAFSYRSIYVHAKLAIIDDEWLVAGSANLNNRGLITDGEMDAAVLDPALARQMRIRLWAEHLGMSEAAVAARDPVDLVDHEWAPRAAANAEIIRQGVHPLIGAVHSYVVGHEAGSLLLEELQSLTFEI